MKNVLGILALVMILGICAPSHAFVFGAGVGNCAVAPYEVTVEYTPITPQPGEYTYCTCLPYGCPDGAPIVNGVPGNCDGGCVGGCVGGFVGGVGGLIGGVCGLVGCVGNAGYCGTLNTAEGIVSNGGGLVGETVGDLTNLVVSVLKCFSVDCGGCASCSAVVASVE